MHTRLRDETAALHSVLEERLDLLAPGMELDRYRAVLRTFYGYYAAIEPRLQALSATHPPLGFELLARTPRIAHDLVALGCTTDELANIARCADLPRLHRSEQLAGCLYVLEGAALGGQIVSRVLEAQFGLSGATGCAFFAGDGLGTGSRWRRVLHWIDELVRGGASGDEIVVCARETFGTLARWVGIRGAPQ
ncbi:MAG TPA: biliverdin-producing heme oxygenase [Polyangiaceae bacterium]|nr:biliverdin-producing heme oxygenase [Polyangiaceae bacterium]